MGPLLIWAMRMVDDLSGDILAAWAERQRLIEAARAATATPAGQAALEAYFRPLIASQAPVPAIRLQGQGLPRPHLRKRHHRRVTRPGRPVQRAGRAGGRGRAAPGPVPAGRPGDRADRRGSRGGRPLDFNEVPALMRHLGTAAFIVCAYLTGMRPEEILGLRTGCCPDPDPGRRRAGPDGT